MQIKELVQSQVDNAAPTNGRLAVVPDSNGAKRNGNATREYPGRACGSVRSNAGIKAQREAQLADAGSNDQREWQIGLTKSLACFSCRN